MFLNDYQDSAWRFATTTSNPIERVMGLLEESGEVAGLYKRLIRDNTAADVFRVKLVKELGDVLWYVSGVAKDNGITLDEVAKTNLHKLSDRLERGVIKGEGDNR